MKQIEFNDYHTMEHVCHDLHDCEFDLETSVFDKETQSWKGKFFRPNYEDEDNIRTERRFLIFKRYIFPTYETTLRLNNVSEVIVNDKAKIRLYTFNKCIKSLNGCRLIFNEDMYIDLKCEGEPKGEMIDKEVPDKNTYMTTMLFMDNGYKTK